MKTAAFALAAWFLAAAAPLFAASPNMQEGQWEYTVKMEMKGMPFTIPPTVYTQCITKDDVKDAKKTLPRSRDKNDCEVKDMKVLGNKTTWRMQCKDGSKGSGEMVYQRTSFSGVMKMETMDKQRGKSSMVQHISARRVGACK